MKVGLWAPSLREALSDVLMRPEGQGWGDRAELPQSEDERKALPRAKGAPEKSVRESEDRLRPKGSAEQTSLDGNKKWQGVRGQGASSEEHGIKNKSEGGETEAREAFVGDLGNENDSDSTDRNQSDCSKS